CAAAGTPACSPRLLTRRPHTGPSTTCGSRWRSWPTTEPPSLRPRPNRRPPSPRKKGKRSPMDLRTLGRTGMRVSPLCLGAMMFGSWGNPDHDDCVRITHAALEAGINLIDTADVYSGGESEEIVAKALAGGRRDGVILATKVHAPMGNDPNMSGNSRLWITREVESSLRR